MQVALQVITSSERGARRMGLARARARRRPLPQTPLHLLLQLEADMPHDQGLNV